MKNNFKESLVSIITPNFNGEKFIIDTIKSVQAQTFSNWEMIIVDDNSVDNSVLLIEGYINSDSRIKLIKNKNNQGAAVSRNTAIECSNGRFIAFLDGDDLWKPNKLSVQIKYMIENDLPFSYSFYDQISEETEFIKKIENLPKKIGYDQLLSKNIIGCLTAVYDTDYFGKIYMPLIRKRQDFGLWLKLLKRTEFGYCIQQNLAQYRIRENSVSSNKIDLVRYHWYLYYNIEKFGFFRSIFLILQYIYINIFKK